MSKITLPIIHFAHANGFPPEAYQEFLRPFQKTHQIITSKFRPLKGDQKPELFNNWEELADDMIEFLDSQGLKNIIGMGHSLGGTTSIIAAMKRPDLFSQLILLDPVIFKGLKFEFVKLLPHSLRKKIVPVAKIAMGRVDRWPSRKDTYNSWRQKGVFKRIPDSTLKNLIEHAVIPDGKGKVKLAYSKAWETQVYITVPLIFSRLKKLKTPMIVVKGEHTDVITPKIWELWQNAQPHNHFINFPDSGHLVPLEHSKALAHKILSILHPSLTNPVDKP